MNSKVTLVFKSGAIARLTLRDVSIERDEDGKISRFEWEGDGDQLLYIDLEDLSAVIVREVSE